MDLFIWLHGNRCDTLRYVEICYELELSTVELYSIRPVSLHL